jgi:hypothetical protein
MITPRDTQILVTIAAYYTLTRAQITRLLFPGDKDGRVTRKRLSALLHLGLINQTRMQVVNPTIGVPAPVFYPSRRGCEYLAATLKDERFLTVCTLTPDWQHLAHWTEVAEFHIVLDQAIAKQSDVQVEHWTSEWDIANPHEKEPAKRFRLYTLIREQPRRLVCNPDAGFVIAYRGFRKAYYVEIDRGTSGIDQVAASKTPGYSELAEQKLSKRHFPDTNVDPFSVLLISPSPGRRDLLRNVIAKKPSATLWKHAAWDDITPDTILHAPVFHDHNGTAAPLVRLVQGGST